MMNTVNTELSSVEVWFTDQASKLLEIEDNANYWEGVIKMRYSTEPKSRKYVKRCGVLSFAKKFGDKYGKNLMDTATKTEIDAVKTASKRLVQKPAEVTGDLIGNKVADKITSLGKSKENANKVEEIYIESEKRQHIIDDLWFKHIIEIVWYKNGISQTSLRFTNIFY